MKKILVLIIIVFPALFVKAQIPYDQTDFVSPLHIPLVLAGNFAELRTNHFHTGLDIKTKGVEGYRIYAIDSGYVSRISISHWGYGKAIYIDHPNGYTSVYAHLSRFPDKIEEYLRKKQFEQQTETITIYPDSTDLIVSKGEIIAYSGNSGSSTAPHLHFEIRETKSEKPVNPLLFNFPIQDNIKPTLFNVKVYPIDGAKVDNAASAKVYALTGSNGNYKLTQSQPITVSGPIGFGIHTIDKLNAAANKCGIYQIQLKVDNQLIYSQKMEKLDFSTNRYINAHKDYDEYHKNRRSFHKSFLSKNNKLEIYDSVKNRGVFDFEDTLVHDIKYIVIDSYGNKSELFFKVKSEKGYVPKIEIDNVDALSDNTLNSENCEVYLPKETVYDDINLKVNESKTTEANSNKVVIGDPDVPVQHYFVMKIKTAGIPANYQDKALIAEVSKKNALIARGGEFKDGWVETKVKSFGTYEVILDTIAPTILPLNFNDGSNVSSKTSISWKIGDNLSGIEDYDVYVDGEWKLANYNPYRAQLVLNFDKYNKIAKGEHEIKVVVKDERNNITIWTGKITR